MSACDSPRSLIESYTVEIPSRFHELCCALYEYADLTPPTQSYQVSKGIAMMWLAEIPYPTLREALSVSAIDSNLVNNQRPMTDECKTRITDKLDAI